MATLDPSEARRLTRLRVLLADAHRRVDDRSDLGEHVAVIALDGLGELAIGLCLHKRGLSTRQREGVPEMLRRLSEDLAAVDPPGSRGFRELHRVRNIVQHEGVLPDAEQLPLWLAETERLVDFLVDRTFGVRLADVSSASGVRDEALRAGLEVAEEALTAGDPKASFDQSWTTLQQGRRRLRDETATRAPAFRQRVGLRDIDRPLETLEAGLKDLTEQLEFAAFTSEPAEWLWLEQTHRETNRRPAPSEAEARRALAFVVGWVLRFDSYLARQSTHRWEEWEAQQRAPVTGVPGGPHVKEVKGVEPRRVVRAEHGRRKEVETYQWIFQLTDVPDTTEPSFDWAVWRTAEEDGRPDITHVHLNRSGHLSVSASKDVEPSEILNFIHRTIELAKARLAERSREREEQLKVSEQLARPFRDAFAEAGIPTRGIAFRCPHDEDPSSPKARVSITIDRSGRGNPSWLANGLRETFDRHFPEHGGQANESNLGFDYVLVPTNWEPGRVARWVEEALAFDAQQHARNQEESQRAEAHRAGALLEMQRQLEADR